VFSAGAAPRLYNEDLRAPEGIIIQMAVKDDGQEIVRKELACDLKNLCGL
jgi:hypothetical protein